MRKIFYFGKIAYNNPKIKNNLVEVEVNLEKKKLKNWDTLEEEDMWIFRASGGLWNAHKTDFVCSGQILDILIEYLDEPLFKKIHKIWEQYHLNDMKPGTKKQYQILKNITTEESVEYKNALELLGENTIDRGYEYGSAWLCKPIPDEVVQEIKSLLD